MNSTVLADSVLTIMHSSIQSLYCTPIDVRRGVATNTIEPVSARPGIFFLPNLFSLRSVISVPNGRPSSPVYDLYVIVSQQ